MAIKSWEKAIGSAGMALIAEVGNSDNGKDSKIFTMKIIGIGGPTKAEP